MNYYSSSSIETKRGFYSTAIAEHSVELTINLTIKYYQMHTNFPLRSSTNNLPATHHDQLHLLQVNLQPKIEAILIYSIG